MLIIQSDNLAYLATLADGAVDLIYIDPPFNTGKARRHARLRTTRSDEGTRIGFGGRRYVAEQGEARSYLDAFDDYLAFLEPRLREAWRVLTACGTR